MHRRAATTMLRAPPRRPASAQGSTLLPRGRHDALVQAAIWAGFAATYELVRGLAAGDSVTAVSHARSVIRLEQKLDWFFEPSLQLKVVHSRLLLDGAHLTYWLAQFAVVAMVVTWVYLRRNGAYPLLRDTLIITNTLGLIGYLAFPVAPPRLVAGFGFHDTFGAGGLLTHQSGIVRLLANQYAAFPSLHAADALILGIAVFALATNRLVRALALVWPIWVWFSLVVSANHFWFDIAAGVVLAGVGWLVAAHVLRPAGRSRAVG